MATHMSKLRLISGLFRSSQGRFLSASTHLQKEVPASHELVDEEVPFKAKPAPSLERAIENFTNTRSTELRCGARVDHYKKLLEQDHIPDHFLPANSIPRYLMQYNRLSTEMVDILINSGKQLMEQTIKDLVRMQDEAAVRAEQQRKECEQLHSDVGLEWRDQEEQQEEALQDRIRKLEIGLSKIRYYAFRDQDKPIEERVCPTKGEPRQQQQRRRHEPEQQRLQNNDYEQKSDDF